MTTYTIAYHVQLVFILHLDQLLVHFVLVGGTKIQKKHLLHV